MIHQLIVQSGMIRTFVALRRTIVAPLAIASVIAFPTIRSAHGQDDETKITRSSQAVIDGRGPGWKTLKEEDFELVNLDADTWTWDGTTGKCTGLPIGVERSKKTFTNFELVVSWRHLKDGGNSGLFIWASPDGMKDLSPGQLPTTGIEVQMLDHGYHAKYEERSGKKGDWFSTHGDIFAVGTSKLQPFAPLSPNGRRSFPSEERSLPSPQWNHYYVRAINGEVRLWVNGKEVSGGNHAEPATGHICLESEGSPIEFQNIRIRELPK